MSFSNLMYSYILNNNTIFKEIQKIKCKINFLITSNTKNAKNVNTLLILSISIGEWQFEATVFLNAQ